MNLQRWVIFMATKFWPLKDQREVLGISDTFIRLSVGLEDEKDLVADLDQALKKAVPEGSY